MGENEGGSRSSTASSPLASTALDSAKHQPKRLRPIKPRIKQTQTASVLAAVPSSNLSTVKALPLAAVQQHPVSAASKQGNGQAETLRLVTNPQAITLLAPSNITPHSNARSYPKIRRRLIRVSLNAVVAFSRRFFTLMKPPKPQERWKGKEGSRIKRLLALKDCFIVSQTIYRE